MADNKLPPLTFEDDEQPQQAALPALTFDDDDDERADIPVDLENPEDHKTHEDYARQAELEKKYGPGESAFYGAIQGIPWIGEGVDELGGGLEAGGSIFGIRGLGEDTLSKLRWETPEEKKQSLKEIYAAARDAKRQRYHERQEANPVAFGGAKIASTLAGSLGTGPMSKLNISKGDSVLKAAGKGALQGGVEGFGASEANDGLGLAVDTGVSGTLGAILGGGSQSLTKSEEAEAFARRRAVKSLDPILSQQEALARGGDADDFGKMLLDEKITRFGSNVDDQLPRLEASLRAKGEEIGAIRAAADAAHAERGIPAVDLGDIRENGEQAVVAAMGDGVDASARAKAYAAQADNLSARPQRTIADTQNTIAQMDLPFSKPRDQWSPEDLGRADMRSDLVAKSEAAIKSGAPEKFDLHQELKKKFAMLKDGEKILDKSTARHARNADFGLRDLLAANAAMKRSDAGSVVQGIATGIATKVARERGNAAAAKSARALSYILKPTSYVANSKFGPALRNAASLGLSNLFVTHQKLMEDPEYSAMVQEDMLQEDAGDAK